MTPIVGIVSDKFDTRMGKRTPWYLAGTILVVPCFAGIWAYPEFINGQNKSEGAQAAWYLILPALLSFGWAAVEISHMSIVNQLSGSNSRRDKLVNNRNGFTAAANFTVLGFALILFITVKNDIDQFRYLTFILIVIGLATSAFYIYTIKEVRMEREALILEALY
jgi:Na+/melibiose symporter-like transporter